VSATLRRSTPTCSAKISSSGKSFACARDAACPISTARGTRRVRLVRGWGGGTCGPRRAQRPHRRARAARRPATVAPATVAARGRVTPSARGHAAPRVAPRRARRAQRRAHLRTQNRPWESPRAATPTPSSPTLRPSRRRPAGRAAPRASAVSAARRRADRFEPRPAPFCFSPPRARRGGARTDKQPPPAAAAAAASAASWSAGGGGSSDSPSPATNSRENLRGGAGRASGSARARRRIRRGTGPPQDPKRPCLGNGRGPCRGEPRARLGARGRGLQRGDTQIGDSARF